MSQPGQSVDPRIEDPTPVTTPEQSEMKSFNPGIFEGCRIHKPRKRFDIECNNCLVRAIRLLADRVTELEKKDD